MRRATPARIALAVVAGCAGLMLPACSPDGPATPPIADVAFEIPVPGDYGIGRERVQWIDAARSGVESAGAPRELQAWIHYPSETARGASEPALEGAWAGAYRPMLARRVGPAAADALQRARWHAITGAPAAAGRFPVLVFAHGYRQLPTNYSALIEALVSRGYVIVALASPGIAEVVPRTDGRLVEKEPLDDASYETSALDIASAVGQLQRLDADPARPYAGRLDLARVGAFGHSLGGAAAVLAAADVQGVRAAANLDGDYSGAAAHAQPSVPLLYVTSQPPNRPAAPISDWDDESSEIRRERIWRQVAARSPNARRVRIGGLFHSNFQDEALLPPSAMPASLRKNRLGSIDGARGLDLVARLLAGFFAETLGGPAAAGVAEVVATCAECDLRARPAPRDAGVAGSVGGEQAAAAPRVARVSSCRGRRA